MNQASEATADEPDWFKQQRGYTVHDCPGELYNVHDDLPERRNRYAEEPERVAELRGILRRVCAEGDVHGGPAPTSRRCPSDHLLAALELMGKVVATVKRRCERFKEISRGMAGLLSRTAWPRRRRSKVRPAR